MKRKIFFYSLVTIIGLIIFILEIFVFQKPDGAIGLIICITSLIMSFGGAVKLCKLSEKFENSFISALDIFFWLP